MKKILLVLFTIAISGCTMQTKQMTSNTIKEPEKVVNKVYTESYPVESYPTLPTSNFVNENEVVVINNQNKQPRPVPMKNNDNNSIVMDGSDYSTDTENLKSSLSTTSIESEVNTTMNDLTKTQPSVVNNNSEQVASSSKEENIDLTSTESNTTNNSNEKAPPSQTFIITDENMTKVNSNSQPGSFNNPVKFVQ